MTLYLKNVRSGATALWRSLLMTFLLCLGLGGSVRPAQAGAWSVSQSGVLLQVSYGSGNNWPVYAAFYLDSSYYRLNPGPGSAWGTSLILQPCYWSEGIYFQGGPLTLVSSTTDNLGNLVLQFDGTIGKLSTTSVVTLYPPASGQLKALSQVWVFGSVALDSNRPGEAFKPVALSTMHDSSTLWDSQYVVTEGGKITSYPPATGWILSQVASQTIGLPGGTSSWKTNAPTIAVVLDQSRPISGWYAADTNPNDDNILVWASSDTILPYWGYWVTAQMPLASVSGTITLQDCNNAAVPLTFEFRPTDGSALFTRNVTPASNGTFSLDSIPTNTYICHIKGAKWLAKNVTIDMTKGNVSNVTATLLAGDADNNNAVDFDDLTILAIAYNTATGDPLFDDRADFNGDGQVEFADLTLLAINYNLEGDP